MVSLAGKGQLRLSAVGLPDSFSRLVAARPLLVLAPTLLLASLLRLIEFTRPFYGHHDWHAAFYALGGAGRRLGEYTNWPPLTDFLYRVALFVFGQGEWSVRVFPVLLSLGTIVVVYLLGKDLFGVGTGLLAALFLAIMPADIYFARIATFHFFIVLTIWSYYRWVLTRRGFYLGLAVASNLVGLGFSYSAVALAGLPDLFLAVKHRDWRGQGALVASTVLALAVWFGYLWATDGFTGPRNAAQADNFTHLLSGSELRAWLDTAGHITKQLFTPVLLVLSVLWLLASLLRRSTGDTIVLLWGLAAFGWLLLAPEHSATHDMWWLILAAPIALAGARALLSANIPWPTRWLPVLMALGFAGWLSIGDTSDLLQPRSSTATQVGQRISQYVDKDDAIVADTPVEIWYSGAKGYLWGYLYSVAGEEGYRQILAEDRPALILPLKQDFPQWQFQDTWDAGYVPLLNFGDRLAYFRRDRAEAVAAGEAARALQLGVVDTVPDGTLITGTKNTRVYYLKWGLKLLAPDSSTFQMLRLATDDAVVLDGATLAAIPDGPPIPHLGEGTLVKGSNPEVYLIAGGERRLIPDPATFRALGFSQAAIASIPDDMLERIALGAAFPSGGGEPLARYQEGR
jgi:hypothetical protein